VGHGAAKDAPAAAQATPGALVHQKPAARLAHLAIGSCAQQSSGCSRSPGHRRRAHGEGRMADPLHERVQQDVQAVIFSCTGAFSRALQKAGRGPWPRALPDRRWVAKGPSWATQQAAAPRTPVRPRRSRAALRSAARWSPPPGSGRHGGNSSPAPHVNVMCGMPAHQLYPLARLLKQGLTAHTRRPPQLRSPSHAAREPPWPAHLQRRRRVRRGASCIQSRCQVRSQVALGREEG
jgi:hypothetical protein